MDELACSFLMPPVPSSWRHHFSPCFFSLLHQQLSLNTRLITSACEHAVSLSFFIKRSLDFISSSRCSHFFSLFFFTTKLKRIVYNQSSLPLLLSFLKSIPVRLSLTPLHCNCFFQPPEGSSSCPILWSIKSPHRTWHVGTIWWSARSPSFMKHPLYLALGHFSLGFSPVLLVTLLTLDCPTSKHWKTQGPLPWPLPYLSRSLSDLIHLPNFKEFQNTYISSLDFSLNERLIYPAPKAFLC